MFNGLDEAVLFDCLGALVSIDGRRGIEPVAGRIDFEAQDTRRVGAA